MENFLHFAGMERDQYKYNFNDVFNFIVKNMNDRIQTENTISEPWTVGIKQSPSFKSQEFEEIFHKKKRKNFVNKHIIYFLGLKNRRVLEIFLLNYSHSMTTILFQTVSFSFIRSSLSHLTIALRHNSHHANKMNNLHFF
ncbi:hypothetical protein BpHYR1_013819 [Brachionus plicatilis]|uniref:Uncharacterized protein n=1 Tax=Brachionus plicatilis TaxID=10195 RepID=A0A3M7SWM0_BRAPC|nr:hypothetical protein BpHYR1_013819 [Brachionus plicatilis]